MTNAPNWQEAERAAQAICAQWAANEPGGIILGFDKDGDRMSVSAGLENLSSGKAFSVNSVGRFASITKHVFCTLVLQHPQLLSLDDRLGDHLPELSAPLADVTVGKALDMTGGLPDMRECLTLLGLSVYNETGSAENHAYMARQTRLNFEAGTEVSYSNTGYRLVEIILERKGVFLKSFLENEVNSLLGTSFDAPHLWADPVKDLYPGYWFNGEKWLLSSAGLQISASGSLAASACDMSKWLRALMAGEGLFAGVLDTLSAPRRLKNGTVTGYGLGITDTLLGDRVLVGHGGSHPGYKAYIMMDRESGTGVVLLSNRDEVDSRGSASRVMAALLGLPMPSAASDRIPDGLYVSKDGPFWLEVAGSTATWIDDGGTLYEADGKAVSSRSTTSELALEWDGEALVGTIGYVPRLLLPVAPTTPDEDQKSGLAGIWHNEEGAFLSIENGAVVMGVGPTRQTMPLLALGGGRYLFTLKDSLWTKRICLNMLDEDRFELVLSRARMIEYRRLV